MRIEALPAEMRVAQRTTTAVPGTRDALRLTIDDITKGQVIASLATSDGASVLAPVSLRQGSSERFEWGGASYLLTLTKLENALVAADHATFVIVAASQTATEAAKIGRLIDAVAAMEGVTFLRNGTEHAPAEAAGHLRAKWEAQAARISTAEQFIEEIASRSSLSGEPYEVRTKDGLVPLARILRAKLAEMK
jgi:hypothetical protein